MSIYLEISDITIFRLIFTQPILNLHLADAEYIEEKKMLLYPGLFYSYLFLFNIAAQWHSGLFWGEKSIKADYL